MKLMVASYNNGAVDWNAEAEETKLRSYSLEHSFNEPAKCIITLADVDGSIMQKYNADANDVYLGVGKLTLEDPTGTDIFYGRIKRVTGDSATKTVTLECYDWLDQLDEKLETIDMREKLNGNIRQSTIKPDYDNTDGFGIQPAYRQVVKFGKADDGGVITDETTETQSAAANDMTLLPANPAVNDAYYFGFYDNTHTSFILNVGTAGEYDGTIVWEYYDGGAWASLGGISDGTNGFLNSGANTVSWNDPGDWAEVAVDGDTCYWIRARVSAWTGIETQPVGTQALMTMYYVYDHDIGLTANAHNGMKMILTAGMAGSISVTTGPYDVTVTPSSAPMLGDAFDNDIGDLWTIDNDGHTTADGDDFTVDYKFKVWVPDSDFHSATILTGAKIDMFYSGSSSGSATIELYNGATYDALADADDGSVLDPVMKTVNIPSNLVASSLDANGEVIVRFNEAAAGGGGFMINYLMVTYNFETTGYSSAINITDGETYRLTVGTDLSADATRVWDGLPYCIAQEIYKHIASDEEDRLIKEDNIVPLTCAATIEHTTGISTRQYKEMTRLAILKDLAQEDMAVFWVTLGGSTLTYKKTFGADTMQLTDSKVNYWQSLYDYGQMTNEYHVYGIRIGDTEIYQSVANAASQTKYLADRSKVLRSTGIVSDAHAKDIGTTLVARDAELSQMVGCEITGNTATAAHATTIRLGEIVEITSSYLWPTASKDYIVTRFVYDYIVTRFVYDSKERKTWLTLHPKVSIGLQELDVPYTREKFLKEKVIRALGDKYIAEPITHEVA
jgi:hypothetical protein